MIIKHLYSMSSQDNFTEISAQYAANYKEFDKQHTGRLDNILLPLDIDNPKKQSLHLND